MTPSKILFFLCLSFIFGIFLESVVKIPQFILWLFLFLSIITIFLSAPLCKRSLAQGSAFIVLGFCILFLILGVLRMQISEFNVANDKLSKLNDKGEITLVGIISNEPDVRDTYQKLKVKIGESTILATTRRYPEYKYLDKIKITGKLETPEEFEDFNYKNYLMKDHIYSVMNFPKIELISQKHQHTVWSFLYEKILFFKQKLRESIRNNFSPPQSSILEGTILGYEGAMDNDLKTKLNITGLRHIIAVSGTHVVILGAILMSFLLFLGFWRSQAFYVSIVFIWFYIILTGLPASGVRAGIMGSLFLLAQKLGRQNAASRTIIMAGAVMLAQNPLLLFYDVGFQLSFLASMGIIYLEPAIKHFLSVCLQTIKRLSLQKIDDRQFSAMTVDRTGNLLAIVSTSFAAQVFTLPIMVYNFGNISFVSPITNILVLPIVSWLMIFGFISVFFGAIFNFLGWILSFPCWILLTYFIKVIDIFSQPWATRTVENVSWIWLAISYLIIGFLVRFLNKLERQKFLGY